MSRILFLLPFILFLFSASAQAHPGGVDRNGCHRDSRTGERHCHGQRAKKHESVCSGRVPATGEDGVLFGPVISVMDGDTFAAKIQGATLKFRLSDIDAPEMDQPYGRESQAALAAALKGKDVVMLKADDDAYGRLVVHVWIGNLHVNRELVANGQAWFYAEYAHDDCLYQVEQEARDAKRGLWALPLAKRIEPWAWRAARREKSAAHH